MPFAALSKCRTAWSIAGEAQRGMAERKEDVSEEKRIEFRAGINFGDILIDGDDVYGDARWFDDLGLEPPFVGCFDRGHRFANAAPSVTELSKPRIALRNASVSTLLLR
jgi:hypothetical protein